MMLIVLRLYWKAAGQVQGHDGHVRHRLPIGVLLLGPTV
jgi:hypothetical protein